MLEISLTRKAPDSLRVVRKPNNEEFDDLNGLLGVLCEELDSLDVANFRISGFGEKEWFVTVETDLPVLLEQLPTIRAALSEGDPFEIDFYEQGLERTLIFNVDGEELEVTCASGTDWVPDPATLRMPKERLIQTLQNVRDAFLACLDVQGFGRQARQWIEEWSSSTDFRNIGTWWQSQSRTS